MNVEQMQGDILRDIDDAPHSDQTKAWKRSLVLMITESEEAGSVEDGSPIAVLTRLASIAAPLYFGMRQLKAKTAGVYAVAFLRLLEQRARALNEVAPHDMKQFQRGMAHARLFIQGKRLNRPTPTQGLPIWLENGHPAPLTTGQCAQALGNLAPLPARQVADVGLRGSDALAGDSGDLSPVRDFLRKSIRRLTFLVENEEMSDEELLSFWLPHVVTSFNELWD